MLECPRHLASCYSDSRIIRQEPCVAAGNELDTNQFKSPQAPTSVGRYHNVRLGKSAALEKQRPGQEC